MFVAIIEQDILIMIMYNKYTSYTIALSWKLSTILTILNLAVRIIRTGLARRRNRCKELAGFDIAG